jgi:hypothetical protein
LEVKDRWGLTPLDEARRGGAAAAVAYLERLLGLARGGGDDEGRVRGRGDTQGLARGAGQECRPVRVGHWRGRGVAACRGPTVTLRLLESSRGASLPIGLGGAMALRGTRLTHAACCSWPCPPQVHHGALGASV